jgi:hypothetical protein
MNALTTYCEESSVHGIRYIFNRKLHLIEKLLWIAALIVSLVCCGLLIFKIGVKFHEDAMVTYTSDIAVAVTDVSRFACQSFQLIEHSFRFHLLL